MAAPLTWSTLRQALGIAIRQLPPPYNVFPPDFAALYPNSTSYAESRICAEIPLLANRTQNTSLITSAGSRVLNLATMATPLIVMEGLALISPAGQTSQAAGTQVPFDKTSLDFIDLIWPVEGTTLNPTLADNIGRWWAPLNADTAGYQGAAEIVIAPTPDDTYTAVCTGLFQPAPISSTNTQTYLSTVYPDLMLAACMVFLEGAIKRNFGAQSDNPQQALSWENIYQGLKAACEFEEMRRRGMIPDQPRGPAPPTRPA